jgi:signal transduction histidine kinase
MIDEEKTASGGTMARFTRLLPLLAIGLVALAVYLLVQAQWHESRLLAREQFISDERAAARSGTVTIERAVSSIYENLRTAASLPGVKEMDRYAQNLSSEARITIQQIYNNLASSVAVSEVYFTPIDFDPARLDPVTGQGEAPAVMFDELVFNAGLKMSREQRFTDANSVRIAKNNGPEEIESFEYVQLKDHAEWLKANYPDMEKTGPLKIPFVAGPEVITCDNTFYITSHHDKDRSGVIFTVPVYDSAGKIHGMVSAIILTSALGNLMQGSTFALVNAENNYVTAPADSSVLQTSEKFVRRAKPDPSLVYSEVIPLAIKDSRHPWVIWSGKPNAAFENSKQMALATKTHNSNLLLLACLILASLIGWWVANLFISNSRKATQIARAAEEQAQTQAAELKKLNENISYLNTELAAKIKSLREAQEDIIKKGKLAQLGQLVATVAHEIRNPLGGISTSAFLLRRLITTPDIRTSASLDRIDNGIKRCDDIITQLLDFSRSGQPQTEKANLDSWVAETVTETAETLPDNISLTCVLSCGEQTVEFDTSRLRRALTNVIQNAAEAMMDNEKKVTRFSGHEPSITVTTQLSKRGAEIHVTDNGPGMDSEVIRRIREPLFTTKSFGTGLGIPAVEKTLDLHGGGLDITSKPGHGATFILWLPTTYQPQDLQVVEAA